MRAYCYASGLIGFGNRVPDGAMVFARGREKALRAFVEVSARRGYSTRLVNGRPTKIPGSETLLVPGVPEAADQNVALDALYAWCNWIGKKPPVGVEILFCGAQAPAPAAMQAAE